jgi:asparagine synthase (glutamine-hydrolysing)
MAHVSSTPVKTFCISFQHEEFDEAIHSRRVAERFGTDHHELRVENDAGKTLDQILPLLDEPFADSSIIPTYEVSRLARRFVTVALSGDGGDELFAGYEHYESNASRAGFDLIPSQIKRLYLSNVYPHLPTSIRRRKLAYNVALNARDRFVDGRSWRSNRDVDPLTKDFRRLISRYRPEAMFQHYFDEAPADDLVSKMQYVDMKTYMTGDVLAKVDRMSMAASLEVRSPLLDHVVAEFVTSLPSRVKLRRRTKKYLLKKLAEKIGVPKEVLYRRKQGFSVPLPHWLRTVLKERVADVLLSSRAVQRGLIDTKIVEHMFAEHSSGERDHSQALWQVFMLEAWARHYLDGSHSPQELEPATPIARG